MAMKKAKKKGPIEYPEGASKKAVSAQSARMTTQAKAPAKVALAKTNAARKKAVPGYKKNEVRGEKKMNKVLGADRLTASGKKVTGYSDKTGKFSYKYTYKGKGSK